MEEVKYCEQCGAYIPSGREKCLACGAPVKLPHTSGDKESVEETAYYNILSEQMLFQNGEAVFDEKRHVFAVKDKVDIDLDSIFNKTCFTCKWRGETQMCYLGKPPIVEYEEIGDHTGRDISGRMYRCIMKRKIHMCIIEQ